MSRVRVRWAVPAAAAPAEVTGTQQPRDIGRARVNCIVTGRRMEIATPEGKSGGKAGSAPKGAQERAAKP